MRLTVWSLGEKFIIAATITLLFCVLLFSVAAVSLLKYHLEREAKSDVFAHLQVTRQAYIAESEALVQAVTLTSHNVTVLSFAQTGISTTGTFMALSELQAQANFSAIALYSSQRQKRAPQLGDITIAAPTSLLNQALSGRAATMLLQTTIDNDTAWVLSVAAPVADRGGKVVGALVGEKLLHAVFTDLPLENETGQELAFCEGGTIQESSLKEMHHAHSIADGVFCTPAAQNSRSMDRPTSQKPIPSRPASNLPARLRW